jgi:manganese transport protein
MPHAIYLHSALTRDRFGAGNPPSTINKLLKASKFDVVGALVVAGGVNVGLLLLAASALRGVPGTDTIEGAHAAINSALGPVVGVVFAVGLLASGLASTSVGCAAGADIMQGLLKVRVPLIARRLVTLIPALAVLALGVEPTFALVLSQVLLSMCIPFALIPLVRYTSDAAIMGPYANRPILTALAWAAAAVIVVLNLALLYLTFTGQ